MMCVCDSEEREYGVGVGVNDTTVSETLWVIRLAEFEIHHGGNGVQYTW